MVGRRTSGACSTCRKRKIKCGLERPVCQKCITAGWPCSYSDRFVASRRASGTQATSRKRQVSNSPKTLVHSRISVLPTSTADKLRLEFIRKMEDDVLAARMTMMPKLHVLKHVPERIGCSQTLDDAVYCIIGDIAPFLHNNATPPRQRYVKALRSLQIALQDPILMGEPETVAAASLLKMYEMYINFSGRKWIYHARGVVRLLQLAGSKEFSNGLKRSILAAEAGDMFLAALTERHYQLLSRSGWRQATCYRKRPLRDRHLDEFMRVIIDGVRFDGVENFCSHFASSCEWDRILLLERHNNLAKGAITDLLHLRAKLHWLADTGSIFAKISDTEDSLALAALTAVECFLLITNSYILWSRTQSAKSKGFSLLALPNGVTDEELEFERADLLNTITNRFNELAILDPKLRATAAGAVRVILGSLEATALPVGGHDEGTTTLLGMLDSTLKDAEWE